MTMISPSLLSADFANLQRDIEMLNESASDDRFARKVHPAG